MLDCLVEFFPLFCDAEIQPCGIERFRLRLFRTFKRLELRNDLLECCLTLGVGRRFDERVDGGVRLCAISERLLRCCGVARCGSVNFPSLLCLCCAALRIAPRFLHSCGSTDLCADRFFRSPSL